MPFQQILQYKHGVYLLTCICGLVDITCFMALNGVFSEMMTGNLMMASISLGTLQPVDNSGKYLRAIVEFIIGLIIGSLILKKVPHERQPCVAYTLIWLLLFLLLILIYTGTSWAAYHHGIYVVGTLCIIMGIHCAIIRIHGLPDLATNLMTMTLTAFITESILLGRTHQVWRRRLLSIGLFFLSGAFCALLIKHVNPYAGLVLALALLTIAIPCLSQKAPAR